MLVHIPQASLDGILRLTPNGKPEFLLQPLIGKNDAIAFLQGVINSLYLVSQRLANRVHDLPFRKSLGA